MTRRLYISFISAMILLTCAVPAEGEAQVWINEICSRNEHILADSDGDHPDWIELRNYGQTAVSLEGYSISDDHDAGTSWPIPAFTLYPGQSVILFASGKNRVQGNEWHTNFRIEAGEESVYLFGTDGKLTDVSPRSDLPLDHSAGRHPAQPDTWIMFEYPTPGVHNQTQHIIALPEEWTGLTLPVHSGWTHFPVDLIIYAQSPQVDLRYTLDGRAPDPSSPAWTGTLRIHHTIEGDHGIRYIPTADAWSVPEGEFPSGITLRVAAFNGEKRVSEILERVFFDAASSDHNPHFSVTALSIPPDHLFDEQTGIYVEGNSPNGNYSNHSHDWERRGYIHFFERFEPMWNGPSGVRIHGRSSRTNPQKSLRLYADHMNDQESFDWSVFGDGINRSPRLILRAPDQLFSPTLFTDDLVHQLIAPLNIDRMKSSPTTVYINGEYWGIHSIRERQDKKWIRALHPEAGDDIDLLDFDRELLVSEGDLNAWNTLESLLRNADPRSEASYAEVQQQVDIESFTDFMVAQLFFSNKDFPVNNVRLWRPREDGGKWRFLFFDCDACMVNFGMGQKEEYWIPENGRDPVSLLFTFLMKNDAYRARFTARSVEIISRHFHTEKVMAEIQRMESLYETEVPRQMRRWGYPESIYSWQNAVRTLKEFSALRPDLFMSQVMEKTGNPFQTYPNPTTDYLHVKMQHGGNWMPGMIKLMNASGKVVREWRFNSETDRLTFNLEDLTTGLYILELYLGDYPFRSKVIVD